METADRTNPFAEVTEASWHTACREPLVPDGETADIAIGGHVDDDPAERSPDHAA